MAARCTCPAGPELRIRSRRLAEADRRRMAGSRRGQGWRDVLRRHPADPPRRHRAAARRPRSGAHRGRHRALRRERPAVLPRRQPGATGQAPGARLAALARLGGAGLRRAAARHRRHRADPPAPGQRRGVAPGGGGAGRGGAGRRSASPCRRWAAWCWVSLWPRASWTPPTAHALGALDELFQAEQWGEDAEAAARRAAIAADIALAARFIALSKEQPA